MKIAQVICVFPPYYSGMGNCVYNFSKVLAEQGHEVTVFTIDYNSERKSLKGKRIKENFKLVRLKPIIKYGNAGLIPQLLWRLKNFDIVHLHYPFYGAAEFVLIRKLLSWRKMKLVLHYHMDSMAKGIRGLISKIYRLIVWPWLFLASKIITCASLDYIKHSNLANYYNKNKMKFRQILFGVDMEKFIIYKTGEKEADKKERTILFVGSLDRAHYFKGVENLLKATKIIIDDTSNNKNSPANSKIKLVIIGEGDFKAHYLELAGNLGINEFVNFAGGIDDAGLVDFYNSCDLVVLPSVNKAEAFGLVLLEAMACAKPVVASNLPGVRGVFRNGREGLLAKPSDVKDLASKLRIILENQTLAKKMGQAGRELVKEKYTWHKVGQRLNLIYHYVRYSP